MSHAFTWSQLHIHALGIEPLKYKSMKTLVENMVKKNRSRFPIAILLTTLIFSH